MTVGVTHLHFDEELGVGRRVLRLVRCKKDEVLFLSPIKVKVPQECFN